MNPKPVAPVVPTMTPAEPVAPMGVGVGSTPSVAPMAPESIVPEVPVAEEPMVPAAGVPQQAMPGAMGGDDKGTV